MVAKWRELKKEIWKIEKMLKINRKESAKNNLKSLNIIKNSKRK